MELCAVPIDKCANIAEQSIASPGCEASPVILGVLPEDLDEIQFRAIGRQIQRDEAVIYQTSISNLLIDVVVHRSIVHHHEGEVVRSGRLCQVVEEVDHTVAGDRMVADVEAELVLAVVESAHHGGSLASQTGIRCMGLPQGRPASLDIGHVREARLVEVEEFDLTRPSTRLNLAHGFLDAPEVQFVPFFLRESRFRLKESPRVFRPTDRRSRLNAGASGKRSCIRVASLARVSGSWRAISAAASSSSPVRFTGAPPLCPSRMPTKPRSRQPLAQFYTGWSLIRRKSQISTTPRPEFSASSPNARRRKSGYLWCFESCSKVSISSAYSGWPSTLRFCIFRFVSVIGASLVLLNQMKQSMFHGG